MWFSKRIKVPQIIWSDWSDWRLISVKVLLKINIQLEYFFIWKRPMIPPGRVVSWKISLKWG